MMSDGGGRGGGSKCVRLYYERRGSSGRRVCMGALQEEELEDAARVYGCTTKGGGGGGGECEQVNTLSMFGNDGNVPVQSLKVITKEHDSPTSSPFWYTGVCLSPCSLENTDITPVLSLM